MSFIKVLLLFFVFCNNDAFKREYRLTRIIMYEFQERRIFNKSRDFFNYKTTQNLIFDKYLRYFGKSYRGSKYKYRSQNFAMSMREAAKLNMKSNGTSRYGPTKFSDLSKAEFARILLNPIHSEGCVPVQSKCWCSKYHDDDNARITLNISDAKLPRKFDWRKKINVGPIADQLLCAGCWAISTAETMQAMAAIQKLQYETLSNQEIIDCAGYQYDGCHGGNVLYALEFLCDACYPVTTEYNYPSTYLPQRCKQRPKSGIRVERYHRLCDINENDDLLKLIAHHGPVIALVNAKSWQNYLGGVIKMNCDESELNHAIQIVGYDLTADVPYYIVRNSWGTLFGHDGYVYVAVGGNVCGIARNVYYINVML